MTSLPLQGRYGACKVPSLFRKRENERRSLNIRRCSARVGNYSGTTAVGGPLPFRSRRSTTACPPTCAIPVAICDRTLTSTRDIAPRLKCAIAVMPKGEANGSNRRRSKGGGLSAVGGSGIAEEGVRRGLL